MKGYDCYPDDEENEDPNNSNGGGNDDLYYEEHLKFSAASSSSLRYSTSSDHRNNDSGTNNHIDGQATRNFSGGSNYNHNKRLSRTSQYSTNSNGGSHYSSSNNSRSNHHHHNRRSQASHSSANTSRTTTTTTTEDDSTIALFGAYGITGHYFLKFALEAGYKVRVLLLPGIVLDDMEGNKNLTVITGAFDDEQKIRRVIRKASYVVCMLNDCDNTRVQNSASSESSSSNYEFVQRLIPFLNEYQKCKVFLYQASSYALDSKGKTPMFSNLKKKMAIRKSARDSFQEQDKIVKYICSQSQSSTDDYNDVDRNTSNSCFKFIITRPSELIWDRPSRKKLAASKSLPGPFPITNIDLAEFSLNSLKIEKLYNSCPYVVQDGV